MMLRLSKNSGLTPHCLKIENAKKLGDGPVAFGGFGDVWKGKIGRHTVCLKIMRSHQASNASRLLKLEYMREAIVWQQLEHPNLLPFMGIYYLDKADEQLCLVSPWMERGNLFDFLHAENVDHYSLVYDIASGLSYLHRKEIVHGDLKSLNILITPEGRACITDFGFSRVRGAHLPGLTSSKVSGGTTRYSAPELLESVGNFSISSDMYAFACVCYEASNVPFHELKLDGAVILAVTNNRRPTRPNTTLLNDEMWNIVVDCWNAQANLRPEAAEVLIRIASLHNPNNSYRTGPGASWDTFDPIQIWKEGKYRYPPLDTSTVTQLQRSLRLSVDA
ncbi:kinase-like protein [Marasmius fiardii PR-910]|nr:kinase-like protein [Marasmius fiardii PR-910]